MHMYGYIVVFVLQSSPQQKLYFKNFISFFVLLLRRLHKHHNINLTDFHICILNLSSIHSMRIKCLLKKNNFSKFHEHWSFRTIEGKFLINCWRSSTYSKYLFYLNNLENLCITQKNEHFADSEVCLEEVLHSTF